MGKLPQDTEVEVLAEATEGQSRMRAAYQRRMDWMGPPSARCIQSHMGPGVTMDSMPLPRLRLQRAPDPTHWIGQKITR